MSELIEKLLEGFGSDEPLKPNEYRCACCGEVYEKGRSDEEASAEREDVFPGFAESECALVCDDCYKAMGFGSAS